MPRRPIPRTLPAILSGIVAWCAVAATGRVVGGAEAPGSPSWAADAEHAVLAQATRPEPRAARLKGTRSADGSTAGALVAIAPQLPALPAPLATSARPGDRGPARLHCYGSSPRSARGPPSQSFA